MGRFAKENYRAFEEKYAKLDMAVKALENCNNVIEEYRSFRRLEDSACNRIILMNNQALTTIRGDK